MASQWDPNSTNYTTQMLLGGPGPAVGGQVTGQGVFTDAQVQQLKDAGITYGDLQSLGVLGPPSTQLSTQAYTSGGQAGVQQPTMQLTSEGRQSLQNAGLLQAMLKLGGGQQQQTGPPAPPSEYGKDYPLYATDAQGLLTGKPVAYAGAQNQASLLGAAALQSPLVINQVPSSALDPKSGVAKVGGALVGSNIPQVGTTWSQLAAQRPYLTPDVIAALQKQGLTANQAAGGVGVKVPLAGPWTTQPGIFTQAQKTTPTLAIPLGAAAQPTATAYNPVATPFAQPPPAAPGLQIPPFVAAAHTSGLIDAGKAIFAHFGGDPNTASPAHIADFHNQLTGMLANYTGGPAGSSGFPPQRGGTGEPWAQPALAAAPQPTAAKRMASGGVVPGRGNKDTVPALLTPGEYVVPKDQVAQLFGGRPPVKMASGGSVQDPDPDPNAPPEARRTMLSAQTSQAPPPAAPGGSNVHSGLTSGLATAAQTYASSMANLPRNPIGSGSGVDIRNTRLDPDPDLPSLKAAGMLGGGAGSGQPTANALSGIGAGLSQAAQAIASSVKPWQMQQSAIPTPPPAPPAPQFTQPQVAQQAQQAVNPYAAYITNQARFPSYT